MTKYDLEMSTNGKGPNVVVVFVKLLAPNMLNLTHSLGLLLVNIFPWA